MHCLAVTTCCGFSLKSATKFNAVASLLTSLVLLCVYASLVVHTAHDITEDTSETTITEATTTKTTSTEATSTEATFTESTSIEAVTTNALSTPTTVLSTTATSKQTPNSTSTLKEPKMTPSPKTETPRNEIPVSSKEKRSVSTDGSEPTSVSPNEADKQVNLLMIYTVALVMYVIETVACILLIHGVQKENAYLMCLWLIWEGVLMVFSVEELVRTSYHQETEGLAHFVHVVIKANFWIVVMSYRLTIVQARGYQLKDTQLPGASEHGDNQ